MDIVEQKRAADQFVKDWLGRGDEKQDTQNLIFAAIWYLLYLMLLCIILVF